MWHLSQEYITGSFLKIEERRPWRELCLHCGDPLPDGGAPRSTG